MKLKASPTSTVKTNSTAKSINCTIGDAAFTIQALRNNFYSYPIQTLVQEYISNARDANLEVGSKKQIIIQAPTKADPVFKVRDFGSGLNSEKLAIFAAYGKSTKRDSNSMVGGFGFGGKAAWAYTDNFTIITYIDGKAYHYLAHLGTSKSGDIEFQGEYDTDEENGTEIVVGVKANDFFEFHKAICRATFFLDDKPEFNGLLEDSHIERELDYWKLAKLHYKIGQTQFFLMKSYQYRNIFMKPKLYRGGIIESGVVILVDKIPYLLDKSFNTNKHLNDFVGIIQENCIVVIEVKNEDVEITANRESLQSSELTISTLNRVFTDLKQELVNHQIKEYQASKSFDEYKKTSLLFHKIFRYPDFVKFNGTQDSYLIDMLNNLSAANLLNFDYYKSYIGACGQLLISKSNTISAETSSLFYEDVPTGKNVIRSKLRAFLKDKGYHQEAIVFKSDNIKEKSFLASMNEIGAIKLSSLPKEAKDPNSKAKKKTDYSELYINKIKVNPNLKANPGFSPYENSISNVSKVVNIKSITEKFVYASHQNGQVLIGDAHNLSRPSEKELRLLSLYLKDKGLQFCSIAPTFIKRIKSAPEFVKIEDYCKPMDQSTIDADEISRLVTLVRFERFKDLENILGFIDPNEFVEPLIRSGFAILCKISKDVKTMDRTRTLPSFILEEQLKSQKVKDERNTINDFFNRLEDHYHLVKAFNLSTEELCLKIRDDFVLYFNKKSEII
jgi:hypothetical protein